MFCPADDARRGRSSWTDHVRRWRAAHQRRGGAAVVLVVRIEYRARSPSRYWSKRFRGGVPAAMFRVSVKFTLLPAVKFAIGAAHRTAAAHGRRGARPACRRRQARRRSSRPGIGSESEGIAASSGPMFRIFIVYVTLLLADAVAGPDLGDGEIGLLGRRGGCAPSRKNRAHAKSRLDKPRSATSAARNDAPSIFLLS